MGIAAGISAGTGIASLLSGREEARKIRSKTKDAVQSAEEKTAAAAQLVIDQDAAAVVAADTKKRKRAQALAAGGRAAQTKTGPAGVTTPGTVEKKTLLGA